MRFIMSTVIHMSEPSRIWRALETSLRDVTIESARTGRQMTVRGLGPSSVSMNHDDFTVFTIEEEQDAAFIKADVFFDGAYLGDFAEPEGAVRSKLNHVFGEIQRQFDLEEMREPRVPAMTETQVAADRPVRDEVSEMPAAASFEAFSNASKAAEPEDYAPAYNAYGELPATWLRKIPRGGFQHFGYLAASICAMGLIVAGVDGVEGHLHREKVGASAANLRPAVKRGDAGNSRNDEHAAMSAPIPTQPWDSSADPKTLLKRWGSAMRTRDAAAQSFFYADPVDFYQNQAGLSRTFVQQEKQAAIEDRKGLWTVKLEGIAIEPQSDNEVRVRLVKHFMERRAPFQVSERFVQTQLFLKRSEGDWKIASEQDFSESASPPRPALTTLSARSGN